MSSMTAINVKPLKADVFGNELDDFDIWDENDDTKWPDSFGKEFENSVNTMQTEVTEGMSSVEQSSSSHEHEGPPKKPERTRSNRGKEGRLAPSRQKQQTVEPENSGSQSHSSCGPPEDNEEASGSLRRRGKLAGSRSRRSKSPGRKRIHTNRKETSVREMMADSDDKADDQKGDDDSKRTASSGGGTVSRSIHRTHSARSLSGRSARSRASSADSDDVTHPLTRTDSKRGSRPSSGRSNVSGSRSGNQKSDGPSPRPGLSRTTSFSRRRNRKPHEKPEPGAATADGSKRLSPSRSQSMNAKIGSTRPRSSKNRGVETTDEEENKAEAATEEGRAPPVRSSSMLPRSQRSQGRPPEKPMSTPTKPSDRKGITPLGRSHSMVMKRQGGRDKPLIERPPPTSTGGRKETSTSLSRSKSMRMKRDNTRSPHLGPAPAQGSEKPRGPPRRGGLVRSSSMNAATVRKQRARKTAREGKCSDDQVDAIWKEGAERPSSVRLVSGVEGL